MASSAIRTRRCRTSVRVPRRRPEPRSEQPALPWHDLQLAAADPTHRRPYRRARTTALELHSNEFRSAGPKNKDQIPLGPGMPMPAARLASPVLPERRVRDLLARREQRVLEPSIEDELVRCTRHAASEELAADLRRCIGIGRQTDRRRGTLGGRDRSAGTAHPGAYPAR